MTVETDGSAPQGDGAPTIVERVRDKPLVIVALCLLGLLFPLHAFSNAADRVLRDYHVAEETAAGPSSLVASPFGNKSVNAQDLDDRARVWSHFERSLERTPATAGGGPAWENPLTVAGWYFSTEMLTAVVVAAAFALLWIHHRRTPAREASGSTSGAVDQLVGATDSVRGSKALLGLIVAWGATSVFANGLVYAQVDDALEGVGTSGVALWLASVLGWFAALAPLLFVLAFVLPILVALIVNLSTAAARLATGLLVVVALSIVVRQGQAEDGLRLMGAGQFAGALLAALATAIVVALAASRGLEQNETPSQPTLAGTSAVRSLLPLAGVAVALVVVGVAVPALRGLVVPGGLLVLLFVLSVPIEDKIDPNPAIEQEPHAATWLEVAAALGAVVPLIVASSTIAAKTIDPLARAGIERGTTAAIIVAAFVACAVLPFVAYGVAGLLLLALNSAEVNRGRIMSAVIAGVVSALALVAVVVLRSDDDGTRAVRVGSMTVVLAFTFVLGAVAVVCRLASDVLSPHRWATPAALRAVRVRHPPLLVGLFAWLLLAPVLGQGEAHDVRRIAGREPGDGLALATFVDGWRARASAPPARPADAGTVAVADAGDDQGSGVEAGGALPGRTIPVVIVAASGGGVRAAYWTSKVFDCIFERTGPADGPCAAPSDRAVARRQLLLAASGASGGSLGIVEWLTYLHAFRDAPAPPSWPEAALGEDFLAPTLATMLLGDGPNLLLRDPNRSGEQDRAATLEQAWERAWRSVPGADGTALTDPFLAGQRAGRVGAPSPDGVVEPLALLNSTNEANGCRVEVSALDAVTADGRQGSHGCVGVRSTSALGGTIDLTDGFVCGPPADGTTNAQNDVRRSTAAMMSARFPFVTPSGWLTSCDLRDRVFTVDGGYLDTSAASTPTELWPHIEARLCPPAADGSTPPCPFTPVFVQIDNDPTDAAQQLVEGPGAAPRQAPDPPNELLVPLAGLNASPGGQADAARADACLLFSGEGRWLRLAVSPAPGAPPPLGWVLSDEAREGLDAALDTVGNRSALAQLHEWLDRGVPAKGPNDTTRC